MLHVNIIKRIRSGPAGLLVIGAELEFAARSKREIELRIEFNSVEQANAIQNSEQESPILCTHLKSLGVSLLTISGGGKILYSYKPGLMLSDL